MRNRVILIALVIGSMTLLPNARSGVVLAGVDPTITMLDDCDPNADWGPAGGCFRSEGSVSRAEFMLFLASPLSPTTVVGHPSWRNDPGYLVVQKGTKINVDNLGGRTHTLTRVAEFGGGFAPPLRVGLVQAPECDPAVNVMVAPGGRTEIQPSEMTLGNNKFMCCIHSWMRAVVKVQPFNPR
jgi:hypothetical protein